MSERISVRVRDCACPDKAHASPDANGLDGDRVFIREKLSLEGGTAAELDLLTVQGIEDEERRAMALMVRWTSTYVRYGASGWNFRHVDPTGAITDRPFDVDVLLDDYELARAVAERCNELYGNGDASPLLRGAQAPNRQQRRSPTGRTGSSTSPRRASTRKPSGSSSAPSSDGRQLRAIG